MEPVYRKQHKNSRRNFDYGRMLGSIRFSQRALKGAYVGLPAELRSYYLDERLLNLLSSKKNLKFFTRQCARKKSKIGTLWAAGKTIKQLAKKVRYNQHRPDRLFSRLGCVLVKTSGGS